eukprot:UN30758
MEYNVKKIHTKVIIREVKLLIEKTPKYRDPKTDPGFRSVQTVLPLGQKELDQVKKLGGFFNNVKKNREKVKQSMVDFTKECGKLDKKVKEHIVKVDLEYENAKKSLQNELTKLKMERKTMIQKELDKYDELEKNVSDSA